MGQKTNPTVLRLEKTNQHFKACWYSNYYYSDQLHNNFKIREYICKIFNRINRCTPLIYIKNNHQSNQILCFFLKKRIRRFKNFKQKKVTAHSNLSTVLSKKWSTFCGAALQEKIRYLKSNVKYHSYTPLVKNMYTNNSSLYAPKNPGILPPTTPIAYPVSGLFYVHNLPSQDKDKLLRPSSPTKDNFNWPALLLGTFYKQSYLLTLAKKRNPSAVPSRASGGDLRNALTLLSTKIKHKTRIENTINLSNFQTGVTDLRNIDKRSAQAGIYGNLPLIPRECGVMDNKVGNYWDDSIHIPKASAVHSAPQVNTKGVKMHTYFGQGNCQTSRKKTNLYPIKVSKMQQNSDFLAQKIMSGLKRRVTYNRLRRQILRDVVKSKYVKGIRVTLSGRVESKSKKAQKARTNTFHWGQTELHVYSSLVQFTNNHLITPFGKIGIKVWICYHS